MNELECSSLSTFHILSSGEDPQSCSVLYFDKRYLKSGDWMLCLLISHYGANKFCGDFCWDIQVSVQILPILLRLLLECSQSFSVPLFGLSLRVHFVIKSHKFSFPE